MRVVCFWLLRLSVTARVGACGSARLRVPARPVRVPPARSAAARRRRQHGATALPRRRLRRARLLCEAIGAALQSDMERAAAAAKDEAHTAAGEATNDKSLQQRPPTRRRRSCAESPHPLCSLLRARCEPALALFLLTARHCGEDERDAWTKPGRTTWEESAAEVQACACWLTALSPRCSTVCRRPHATH